MPTLKETVIELADCNSSLVLLEPKPVAGALPLATADEYCGLYRKVVAERLDAATVLGRPGAVLSRFESVYHANRFWHYFFGNGEAESYADLAWEKLSPLAARLVPRITASPGAGLGVGVSPIPRVLLYPFGWSTWISLRITGEHSLDDLAAILEHLVREPAFTLPTDPAEPVPLSEVFLQVSRGVWKDAFGGGRKRLFNPPDVLSVTTVLDKFGGAPAIQAPVAGQEEALRRLVSPGQTPSVKPWKDILRPLPKGKAAGNLDYALQDGSGVFIWADHLLNLKLNDRNRQHLRCYHKNTFLALLHAWQLSVFLEQAVGARKRSDALAELVAAARTQLEQPLTKRHLYRNVSLVSFLERKDVQAAVEVARHAFA